MKNKAVLGFHYIEILNPILSKHGFTQFIERKKKNKKRKIFDLYTQPNLFCFL